MITGPNVYAPPGSRYSGFTCSSTGASYASTIDYAQRHGLRPGSVGVSSCTSNGDAGQVPVHHNGVNLRDLVAPDARPLYDRVDFLTGEGQALIPMLTAYLQTQNEISRVDFVNVVRGSPTSEGFKQALLAP